MNLWLLGPLKEKKQITRNQTNQASSSTFKEIATKLQQNTASNSEEESPIQRPRRATATYASVASTMPHRRTTETPQNNQEVSTSKKPRRSTTPCEVKPTGKSSKPQTGNKLTKLPNEMEIVCKVCNKKCKSLKVHFRYSPSCRDSYDMRALDEELRRVQNERKRSASKESYKEL